MAHGLKRPDLESSTWPSLVPRITERKALRYVPCALLLLFTVYPSYKYHAVGVVPLLVPLVKSKKGVVGFSL